MSEPLYAQRYRLVEALPPGWALAVHRAQDAGGPPVRITVVRPADPDAFMRHMGVVAAARHLDLPAVLDIGRTAPTCFVVTEDVRGDDAAALVARGPLPVAAATMIAAEAAAGLAALHAHGAVHGGVEPADGRADRRRHRQAHRRRAGRRVPAARPARRRAGRRRAAT